MMNWKRLFSMLVVLQLFGCSQQLNLNNELFTLNPFKSRNITDENIGAIIDDIKVIKLESVDSSLITVIKKVLITANGDFIILDKTGIMQFSGEGHFIRRIGETGRANNEYMALENICIDGSNTQLLVLDAMNKVLCYDIESGRFIRSVVPNWGGTIQGLYDIIPSNDDGFYILSCNTNVTRSDDIVNTIYKFSYDGIKTEESLPIKDFMITMFLASQSYGNHYLVRPFDNNNVVYRTSDIGLQPYFNINFEDKNVPAGQIYNDSGIVDMSVYFQSNYYKFPSMIQETQDHISFMYAGPNFGAFSFVVNKHTGNGIMLKATDGRTQPFNSIVSDKNYMYFVMNKLSEDGLDEQADPLTRYIVEKYGTLGIDENPRLVGVKFKI